MVFGRNWSILLSQPWDCGKGVGHGVVCEHLVSKPCVNVDAPWPHCTRTDLVSVYLLGEVNLKSDPLMCINCHLCCEQQSSVVYVAYVDRSGGSLS